MTDDESTPKIPGPRTSLEEFYSEAFVRLVGLLIKRYGLNQMDAEDIAHEAYSKVAERWKEMNPRQFKSWWYQRAKWDALDFLKQQKRQTLVDEFEERWSSADSPEDEAVLGDGMRLIAKAARGLPEAKRLHLYMVAAGWTSGEAAHVLGINGQAERTARHRLLRAMRQRMTDAGWEAGHA
ncbi:RNA polymerase sigma factor [Streptomyces albidoflavus]|uniref:RNA polymerase sigma factor n=1 Tax=Streptomyces albidoflavus TaxID=1886 RepID=UPI0015C46A9B|nr:sigma-70 family RNA polymerase sigma factor [Streptomyces albidoflavus]